VTRALLGLGANVGNREANMRLALRMLGEGCVVLAVSSLYASPAVVLEGEEPGPDYLNAACVVETELNPQDLLRVVKRIEHDIGRRPAPRWAARPIDIDIELYGDAVIETGELRIPHPLMLERAFVMTPLAEVASEAVHPLARRTIGEQSEDVDVSMLRHVRGPEWAECSAALT
jgi:2-amino-4-hydroxy-6-hydroxymethyldihydropteridine diphosphokinase